MINRSTISVRQRTEPLWSQKGDSREISAATGPKLLPPRTPRYRQDHLAQSQDRGRLPRHPRRPPAGVAPAGVHSQGATGNRRAPEALPLRCRGLPRTPPRGTTGPAAGNRRSCPRGAELLNTCTRGSPTDEVTSNSRTGARAPEAKSTSSSTARTDSGPWK